MQNSSVANKSPGQGHNTDLANQTMMKVVELFSSQQLTSIVKESFIDVQGKPSSKWSLTNRVLMRAQGTRDARGFNQWYQVGRHVKKGSKAIYIFRPRIVKTKEENEEKEMCVGFGCLPVFRYEDTEGKPLEECANIPLPNLANVAKAWGYEIEYGSSAYGGLGCIQVKERKIRMATKSDKTFYHELVHAGQAKLEGALKPGQDAEQEIIAEFGAAVLAAMYGDDSLGDSYQYIGSYAKSDKPEVVGRACLKVLSKVEKILRLILDEEKKLQEKAICQVITV